MVKGVNKQIIEINDTGSKYFERVLLFVSPGRSDLSHEKLTAEAKEYLLKLSPESSSSKSLRQRHKSSLKKRRIAIAAVSIVALTLAATTILLNVL